MRISDWSSDVCSSDLIDARFRIQLLILHEHKIPDFNESVAIFIGGASWASWKMRAMIIEDFRTGATWTRLSPRPVIIRRSAGGHTSKLQSLMRISYAVICLNQQLTSIRMNSRHYRTPRRQTAHAHNTT